MAVHSSAQAATYTFGDRCRCLGNGMELSCYNFCPEPELWLGWVGRIAPEKGLEDAVAGLVKAINRLDRINCYTCRQQVEAKYSMQAMCDTFLRNRLRQREICVG